MTPMRDTIPTWTPSQRFESPTDPSRYTPPTSIPIGTRLLEASRAVASAPPQIGCYRLDHQIGEGGCSRIFIAQQLEGGRRVAIKIPKEPSQTLRSQIKQEFRAARRLDHPHIVRMHRLLPVGDQFAAVMEWLGGPSLMERVRGSLPHGTLPSLPHLNHIAAQLAAALAHIHASGWVHGDIKPDNVHFTGDGVPRWIDFGLATRLDRPTWMPRPENLIGTFAYLPPESILGDPLTPASDMFSFGRLLLRLVCGRLPSWDPGMGENASAARIRHQLPPGTPRSWTDVCTRLVRLAPSDRPTAAEVYEILVGSPLPAFKEMPCAPPRPVFAAAHQALMRADAGRGTLLLVESDQPARIDLEPLIATIRSEEPRLVLSGCCDSGERTPLPAFDAILDQLGDWVRQVPATLRDDWRRSAGDALGWANPELAAALGVPSPGAPGGLLANPEAACDAVARLLAQIAEQRTVVLMIRGIDRFDGASGKLLTRLLSQMPSLPIVVVATARRQNHAWRRAVPSESLAPVVSHVRC